MPQATPFAIDPRLKEVAASQPHPLLFVTISGAHLYGFPSADSDYDLRGVHVLPARDVLGLHEPAETIEVARKAADLELDLVSHDARKFFTLMLKKNGYVLEQLYSPLIVHTTPEHEELKALGKGCVTRHHAHHYLGFTETQWKLFAKESPPRVKPLLYVYRVLLTGIHLMQTGVVEANLLRLNADFRLPYLEDLVARKTGGAEKGVLNDADLAFHEGERQRLEHMLRDASAASHLPEVASSKDGLSDLLVRLRTNSEVSHT
jgi:predicted nucleotidyltransferase